MSHHGPLFTFLRYSSAASASRCLSSSPLLPSLPPINGRYREYDIRTFALALRSASIKLYNIQSATCAVDQTGNSHGILYLPLQYQTDMNSPRCFAPAAWMPSAPAQQEQPPLSSKRYHLTSAFKLMLAQR
ncbi:hypothetical protein BJX70DRAFT_67921 [Aspergillus crustosus]